MEPHHWFLLAFAIPAHGFTAFTSIHVACKTTNLNIPLLAEVRRKEGLPETATMIGASYLGFMTQEEMMGKPVPGVVTA